MNYLEKIKELSKIQVAPICKELNIDRSNLLNGRSSEANERKVYEEIIKRYEQIKNIDSRSKK